MFLNPKLKSHKSSLYQYISIEQCGSGLVTIFIGLMITLLLVLVFVNIADYSLYSLKRNALSRAIDYAVCAAIQEIDYTQSEDGLAEGYDEITGKVSVKGIVINEAAANNAFFSTLNKNIVFPITDIKENTIILISYPSQSDMQYIITKGSYRDEGKVSSPDQLESVINNNIQINWSDDSIDKTQKIYVNGNTKTTQFKMIPYFLVFIKNYEIDGLFRKREATFIGFSGAKLERRK